MSKTYMPGGSIVSQLEADQKIKSFFKEFARRHLFVLDSTLVHNIARWMENLGENFVRIREGSFIRNLPADPDGPTIIVGGGPSINKNEHLLLLKKAYEFKEHCNGMIFSTDRMLIPLLENGIIPDFVASCDGHPDIFNFYNHPLVEKYAGRIRAALLATTVTPGVTKLWEGSKGKIFWYNIIFDNPQDPMGITHAVHYLTGGDTHATTLDTLGNIGAGCFVLALHFQRGSKKKKPIGLIGMDFSLEGKDPRDTDYWDKFLKLKHDGILKLPEEYFKVIRNPESETWHVVPFDFDLYRVTFLNVIRGLQPKCHVVNCSEQGVLYSNELRPMKFKKFLGRYWK